MVPKHSLLKYFTLTFTRHKSSKFEGSGPPLKSKDTQFTAVKGGPEPLEKEIHEILGSKCED